MWFLRDLFFLETDKRNTDKILSSDISLKTPRFILRKLLPSDVSEKYLNWLNTPDSKRYIEYSKSEQSLDSLLEYVSNKANQENCLFWGIFDLKTGDHIGNLKYEPIDIKQKITTMGILIGDTNWRGQGVAPEVLRSSAYWLKKNLGLEKITLGVDKDNIAAIRAYRKVGFLQSADLDVSLSAISMTLETKNLKVNNSQRGELI